jgi:Ca2+-binding EF-hand superfamily protein
MASLEALRDEHYGIKQEHEAIRREMAGLNQRHSALSERHAAYAARLDQFGQQGPANGGMARAPAPRAREAWSKPQSTPAKPASPTYSGYSPPTSPMRGPIAMSDIIDKSLKGSKKMDTWEKQTDPRKSTSSIDRCEKMMKEAFGRYFSDRGKSAQQSPVTALQTVLRTLDANHSGKVSVKEFKALRDVLQFSAHDATMEALFQRFDLDRNNHIDTAELAQLLLDPQGTATSTAKSCIARMREVLCYRAGGFPSLAAIGRQFNIIDRDNSGELSKEEFGIMLSTFFTYYGITWTRKEKESLTMFFDKDGSGRISYDEYLAAVRGEMNEFREEWVKQAFDVLDTKRQGFISVNDMMSRYDISQNPAVKSGKIKPAEAQQEFLNNYDLNKDGTITFDEFLKVYQLISASIDSDDYFELMMRNAWHISGGQGWSENTANRRVLVQYTDGRQSVEEIQQDLGLDIYDQAAVVARLNRQGIKNIAKIEVLGAV